MDISRYQARLCDICGNRGPCNWCGRREKLEKYVELDDEIEHAENVGSDTVNNDSDTAQQPYWDESQDDISMAQQRERYESRQLSKDKGNL